MISTTLLPFDQDNSSARVREENLRKIVDENYVPDRHCYVVQAQIRKTLTMFVKCNLSLETSFFRFQPHGTFVNRTASASDCMRVLLVLEANVPEKDIVKALINCGQISHFRSEKSGYRFQITTSVQDIRSQFLEDTLQGRRLQTINCNLEIVQVSSLKQRDFESYNIYPCFYTKFDVSLVTDSPKSALYFQQLSRYLNIHKVHPHLKYTIILLRMMAREHGLESLQDGHFSPTIIQLLVVRYHEELSVLDLDGHTADYIDHFNLARYVCKRVSEFDYRNFEWGLEGDKESVGHALRIQHPAYPDYCLTQNLTSETTIAIMHALARAAEAETLEAFIGSSHLLLD